MTDTYQIFIDELKTAMENAKYRSDADINPLKRAAAKHLASGRVSVPEIAPCLAVLWFSAFERKSKFRLRLAVWWAVFSMRNITLRNRPMWNDFWMGLWQLSRDPRYIGELYEHLRRAYRKRIIPQIETGAWMISSVCQQDPIFAEHWADLSKERGQFWGETA